MGRPAKWCSARKPIRTPPHVRDAGALTVELCPRFRRRFAEPPAAALDIDCNDLAAVLGLDLGADVALVDFAADAGDFVGGPSQCHGCVLVGECVVDVGVPL